MSEEKVEGSECVLRKGILEGKVLVITGGGSGIGRQTALYAAQLGAKAIAICGRKIEPLQESARLIQQQGPTKVMFAPCDLRDYESVEVFVKKVLKEFSRIDVLINNAGGQFLSPAEHVSGKGFEAVIRNNLLVTFNVTRSVAVHAFIPQNSGSVVTVTAQVKTGFPGMVHTGAARSGIENMTMSLAVEWSRFGIRINCVAPGVIKTEGTNQYPPAFMERALSKTLVGRLGNPKEVANLILYLASDECASFITGQTFYIDGGQSLSGPFFSPDLLMPTKPKL